MTYVTIRDARTGQHITGRHVRDYSNGLTIEDSRGVLHYATTDRVINRNADKPRTIETVNGYTITLYPETHTRAVRGDLFHD